jgi:acetylornithine deacetylase/succinyl-diaminopimelate desuccinylase-like protein
MCPARLRVDAATRLQRCMTLCEPRAKVFGMRASHLEDYYQFLRFPSISTNAEYADNVAECAHWLVEKLTAIGLEAKLMPTPGHPSFGQRTNISRAARR